jgi:hypothetical protein
MGANHEERLGLDAVTAFFFLVSTFWIIGSPLVVVVAVGVTAAAAAVGAAAASRHRASLEIVWSAVVFAGRYRAQGWRGQSP